MDTSILRFAIVGGFGTIVNTGYLILFKEFIGLPLWISSVLAIAIAMFFNFILNDAYTFEAETLELKRLIQFVFVSSLGVIINISILLELSSLGLYYLVANVVGILCAFAFNYTLSKKFIWSET